jgi:hypothetical protein
VTDGKSYALAIAGVVATTAYELGYIDFNRWTVIMGLVNGTAIATLRAAQGKTIQEVKTATAAATEAASEAAVQAAVTQQVIQRVAPGPPAPAAAAPLPSPAPGPKPRED